MWHAIEKTVKTWVLRQIERRMPERRLTPDQVDWSAVRRILIVRQHDQFGDFLLTTPAIRALRNRFPDASITLVVRSYLLPVAQHNPHVDHVLVFHETAGRWTPQVGFDFARRLRGRFDLAVVFNTVSHSFSSDLIAYGSGAPLVLGPERPTFDHCARNPFYTLVAPHDPAEKHEIHRNLDVARYIGADTDDYTYGFALTEEEMATGQRLLDDVGWNDGKRMVAVHFGTKDVRKRYPIPMLAALCDRVAAQSGARLLVLRAPGEESLLRAFQQRVSCAAVVAPALTLREAAAVLKAVDLLICNDTGVLHLAAAVGTPTVSFHATSDPVFWKPVGGRYLALYAANGDIASIPVEQAFEAVEQTLCGETVSEDDTVVRCE